jgi:diacylglycerol O-acyltransferase / wax synthase
MVGARQSAPSGERLSFDDVEILRLESAAIRGHTCKLLLAEADSTGEPLDPSQLHAYVGERVATVPRLRERVVMPRRGQPRWEPDPDFDLGNHVVDRGGPPLSEDGLRDAVGEVMSNRLDHERPLWRLDLLPLEDGATAVVVRIHHCMADGVSAMRILSQVLWEAEDASGPARAPVSGGTARRTPRVPVPSGGADAPSHLGAASSRLLRLPRTLLRELRPGGETPLDRHIGSRREVAWASYPLAEMKRIEHAAGSGITVNDVVLAAISGALRGWLARGDSDHTLRVQVPVSLHARDASPTEIGNRDSFLFVDLPLDEPDAVSGLRRIAAETHQRKLDHDAETLYAFFHALAHFRPLYRGATRLLSGPREFALSVSNVPGPPRPVTVLGRRLRRFSSFAEPADRHALRISAVSLGGEVNFGLCSDPDAVAGLDRLAEGLAESLEELSRAV